MPTYTSLLGKTGKPLSNAVSRLRISLIERSDQELPKLAEALAGEIILAKLACRVIEPVNSERLHEALRENIGLIEGIGEALVEALKKQTDPELVCCIADMLRFYLGALKRSSPERAEQLQNKACRKI